jgi:hypothetical protein
VLIESKIQSFYKEEEAMTFYKDYMAKRRRSMKIEGLLFYEALISDTVVA